jgi:hypothetical protein
MTQLQRLSNELLDRIMCFVRCSQNKQVFLESCKLARELYNTSREIQRAFQNEQTLNDALSNAIDCRNGACGRSMLYRSQVVCFYPDEQTLNDALSNAIDCRTEAYERSMRYRSQCCFHPELDTEGTFLYACCSGKCDKVIQHDIRTKYATVVYMREVGFCCDHCGDQLLGSQCVGCGGTVGPPPAIDATYIKYYDHYGHMTIDYAEQDTAPSKQEFDIDGDDDITYVTVAYPHHIGAELNEIPDHTLQRFNGRWSECTNRY